MLELIHQLETQISDLEARLPAHSIPPSMIATLDHLEEQLNEVITELSEIQNQDN